jgi:hypothetical protein
MSRRSFQWLEIAGGLQERRIDLSDYDEFFAASEPGTKYSWGFMSDWMDLLLGFVLWLAHQEDVTYIVYGRTRSGARHELVTGLNKKQAMCMARRLQDILEAAARPGVEADQDLPPAPRRPSADGAISDDLEAVLDQLELPATGAETDVGVALDGAELFAVFMHPRATAAEIASLDVDALTKEVTYRRKKKAAPGAVDPTLTDEQIARAILDYVRTAPFDLRPSQVEFGTSPTAVPPGIDIVRSAHGPGGLQIMRIVVVIVGLVAMFAPWGRDGGAISNGWGFAVYFTLLSCGVLGLGYLGLLLYIVSVLKPGDRVRIFWLSRLALVLWLLLGPYFVLGTNIRVWPLEITWGAWLFLVAISLANVIEGLSLILWGRGMTRKIWPVTGAVWLCLSLLVLPVFASITHTETTELGAEELLAQYQSGERVFKNLVVQYPRLVEVSLPGALADGDLAGQERPAGQVTRRELEPEGAKQSADQRIEAAPL